MMFIDIFLYLLLAWYADAVLPSWAREFGVPRPFYFPCMPSYWVECCGCSRRSSGALPSATAPGGAILAAAGGGGSAGDGRKHNLDPADASYFEVPDSAQQAMEREGRCVQFVGVRKEFGTPDGVKVAVDDLNLTFYAGQITCLLGHNGAGKSTAINMLTGLYPPTSGHIRVFGRDVREDNFASLFASLGVVSQQDVLWPELTVREHLQLFATVKSVPRGEASAAMLKVIQQVGLTEKIDAQSGQLSGGQKRKLMLAIALLGGSKVIILDEVTSGMDPVSRRSTWQAIQEAKREGRTILMSTVSRIGTCGTLRDY
jgi:ABC-type Na+ transport system ATPase subunit NatA